MGKSIYKYIFKLTDYMIKGQKLSQIDGRTISRHTQILFNTIQIHTNFFLTILFSLVKRKCLILLYVFFMQIIRLVINFLNFQHHSTISVNVIIRKTKRLKVSITKFKFPTCIKIFNPCLPKKKNN